MAITVAEYVANFFSQKGIKDVFMVTGGGAMFLNDALSRNKKLRVSCFHHEQGCSMAAEAYFKVSQKPVLVNVTTGPGCTNAITGVYGAYVDSAAMIVISGQVKRPTMKRFDNPDLRQLGDQEIDIVPIVKTITKYSVLIDDATTLDYELNKAYYFAMSGRPGPVWLDIPIDVQSATVPPQKKNFKIPATPKKTQSVAKIKILINKLKAAERPVIVAGTGIHGSQTTQKLLKFAEKYDIPIVSSFCASDVVPSDHRLFIGRQGTIGDRAGNFAVQNADLVMVLGSRLNIRQVSYGWANFAAKAYKVMVDIDIAEMNKSTLDLDLKIHSDLNDFFISLETILKTEKIPKKKQYLKWCTIRKDKYLTVLPVHYKSESVNPYAFMKEISQAIPERTVIVTADGTAAITSFQAFETKKGQRLFSNSGSAPMGFDLPAAIGAFLSIKGDKNYQQKVICFAGDGSVMMNLQELQTFKTLKIPAVIFILNNGGYMSILQTQRNYFKDNIFGCINSDELSFPDFKKIAAGFDIKFIRLNTLKDIKDVTASLSNNETVICEVMLDQNQMFEPKLVSRRLADGSFKSPELDDMFPFLSDKELSENRLA